MENKTYFKKNISDKIICSVCGSKNFKSITMYEKMHSEKLMLISITMICMDDHVSHAREYKKSTQK